MDVDRRFPQGCIRRTNDFKKKKKTRQILQGLNSSQRYDYPDSHEMMSAEVHNKAQEWLDTWIFTRSFQAGHVESVLKCAKQKYGPRDGARHLVAQASSSRHIGWGIGSLKVTIVCIKSSINRQISLYQEDTQHCSQLIYQSPLLLVVW